jgi:hypothetical protein
LRHRQINNVIHFPKEFTEKKCNIGIYGNFGVGSEIVGLSVEIIKWFHNFTMSFKKSRFFENFYLKSQQ